MKVLVCGAGVQGSYCATHLLRHGIDVALLARGNTFERYSRQGIRLAIHPSDVVQEFHVPLVNPSSLEGGYDLYLVIMQKQQAKSFSEDLGDIIGNGTALFLGNNGTGTRDYISHLEEERILLGFFGVSGYREADFLRLGIADIPPIWIGAPSSMAQGRLAEAISFLRTTGFDIEEPHSIDGWLKCHIALILPLAGAVYGAGTNTYRLSRTPSLIKLMVTGLKETISVMRKLGIRIEPAKFSFLSRMPNWYLKRMFEKMMERRESEISLGGHAGAARSEMQYLAGELQELIDKSCLETPAYNKLIEYLHNADLAVDEGYEGSLL